MTVLAAESIPCAAADWSAAVVVVLRGQLLLECLSGRCSTFAEGAVLPLSGLHLRRITNIGLEPLVLRTIRRDPSS
ncbi:hypothetical protein [Motilibacter rhizosphaerae]|nr:hypothetical protein [Motilibacter rhizosphaerae]